MKQLFILSLLVPMLCFANESEPMSLEDEVSAKLGELRRVQNAVEAARATNTEVVEVAEDTELGIVAKTYGIGVIISSGIALVISLAILFGMGWRCLRFNYHYYIEYGDYRLGWGLEIGEREQIKLILNKLNYEVLETDDSNGDFMETSWFGFLSMWFLGTLAMALGALAWPITLIILGPNLLTELVAHKPRKKKIFEKKLKGEMTNESV